MIEVSETIRMNFSPRQVLTWLEGAESMKADLEGCLSAWALSQRFRAQRATWTALPLELRCYVLDVFVRRWGEVHKIHPGRVSAEPRRC